MARLNWETPVEVGYLTQLVQLAGDVDSMIYYYDALSSLGRYYCNVNKRDSLFYWGGILDSVTKEHKDTPEELFDFLNYYCRYYLINGEYELAMNEAVRLQMLSDETGVLRGAISSNEYLGMIYLLIGRDKDAIVAFEKGLSLIKDSGGDPSYEIQIMSYLLISYQRLNEWDKTKSVLERFGYLLREMRRSHLRNGSIIRSIKSIVFCIRIILICMWLSRNRLKRIRPYKRQELILKIRMMPI